MKKYPQMLYRFDTHRIVQDEAEHEAAKADGWLTWDERFRPVAEPVPPKPRRKGR